MLDKDRIEDIKKLLEEWSITHRLAKARKQACLDLLLSHDELVERVKETAKKFYDQGWDDYREDVYNPPPDPKAEEKGHKS